MIKLEYLSKKASKAWMLCMNASPLMNEWIRFGSPSLVEQICRGSNRQQVARRQIWVSVRPPELCKLQGHCNLDKLLKLLWAVTSVSSVTFLLNRIAANCIKVKLKCCNFCILPLLYRRYSTTLPSPRSVELWACATRHYPPNTYMTSSFVRCIDEFV